VAAKKENQARKKAETIEEIKFVPLGELKGAMRQLLSAKKQEAPKRTANNSPNTNPQAADISGTLTVNT